MGEHGLYPRTKGSLCPRFNTTFPSRSWESGCLSVPQLRAGGRWQIHGRQFVLPLCAGKWQRPARCPAGGPARRPPCPPHRGTGPLGSGTPPSPRHRPGRSRSARRGAGGPAEPRLRTSGPPSSPLKTPAQKERVERGNASQRRGAARAQQPPRSPACAGEKPPAENPQRGGGRSSEGRGAQRGSRAPLPALPAQPRRKAPSSPAVKNSRNVLNRIKRWDQKMSGSEAARCRSFGGGVCPSPRAWAEALSPALGAGAHTKNLGITGKKKE